MQAPLTKTIFKSSKIYFETMSDDNRCVKASDKINNSELLLVELVYSSDNYIDEGIRFIRITDINEDGTLNPNNGKITRKCKK